jgi:uncharacterized RDD family membrane protein YckC
MIRMADDPADEWVDGDSVMTGEAVALALRPTGFALRAGGAIIDALVSIIAFVVLVIGLSVVGGSLRVEETFYNISAIAALVFCLVIIPAAVETLSRGKSLGRLAVGARIVRNDGGAAGVRHALIRALVGVLEIYLTLGGLAAVTGLLSQKSRRLGDLLAGTYSQNERPGALPPAPFGAPLPLVAWTATADVARMPEALGRRIRNFLAQAPDLDPVRRQHLARELANEASRYVSPLPAIDPELFLAGVVVVRRERETAALGLEARRLARVDGALAGLPHGFPQRDA